jgi:hypothetical protein
MHMKLELGVFGVAKKLVKNIVHLLFSKKIFVQ